MNKIATESVVGQGFSLASLISKPKGLPYNESIWIINKEKK